MSTYIQQMIDELTDASASENSGESSPADSDSELK
jgi:hypothetical protein